MSRTGKKPVAPVDGVTVSIDGRTVKAKGPKGVMADHEARSQNIGGEVLCRVF